MMWKTLFGRCIYESSGGSRVYQNYVYRWLTFGSNALQTLINRRYPQRPGLDYVNPMIRAVREQPADCCLLGLGGAGIAHALSNHLGTAQIVAVESSLDVIQTAKAYFQTNQLKNLTLVHQDASLFVEQCNVKYQHLLIDLYDAYSFPTHCSNESFFTHCKRLLLPEGIIAINLANLSQQRPVFEIIRNIFNSCTISFPVKGSANLVIVACKADSITPLLNLLQKRNPLKTLAWDDTWGCIAEI